MTRGRLATASRGKSYRSGPARRPGTCWNHCLRARRPVELGSQVVHGDLPGNVLFADGLPPAIIDWPVYWRPVSWALAVAVADAVCWYGAGPELVARWSHLPAWSQMLIRAMIYRIVTHEAAFGPSGWTRDQIRAYRPAIDLVGGG